MKKILNPFEMMTYLGPEYFCDREDEITALNSSLENRRNVVLSSPRRYGKTNLLLHWHHLLNKIKGNTTIYLDILYTKSDKEFCEYFASKVLKAVSDKDNIIQKTLHSFGKLRPSVSIDPYSGSPTVSLDVKHEEDVRIGIEASFQLLSEKFSKVQIAIDEFQVIEEYEQKSKIDAILRNQISQTPNVHFIFSGSQESILSNLFSNPQKPMFASTQHISLGKIGYRPYFEFIKLHFANYKRGITDEAVHEILTWTKQHTFYTHFLANEVFTSQSKNVTISDVNSAKDRVLKLFEINFQTTLRTLPKNQKLVLIAIAKEGEVLEITSKQILGKYNLSAASTVLALKGLIEKEIVKQDLSKNESPYFVQDVFLARYISTFY